MALGWILYTSKKGDEIRAFHVAEKKFTVESVKGLNFIKTR
jgi:hypothetical protein